jgi:hypothetical protein
MVSPKRLAMETTLVFVAAAVGLGWVIFPLDGFLGPDTYYHFRLAAEGPWDGISALPLTLLAENGPDHHLLWHVFLIPFTWASDPFTGMQWGVVITGALVPAGLYVFARKMAIPWAWLIVFLAVVGATIMPGRLVMLRAQNIAILLMAWSLWVLVKKQYKLLGLVAFIFMGTYHGAVLLGPVTFIYVTVIAFYERRFAWQPLAYAALGGLLGLIISPFFPRTFEYLFFHTIYTVPEAGLSTGGGSEWSSLPWEMILTHGWPIHVALLTTLVFTFITHRKKPGASFLQADTMLVLAVTVMTLVMYKSSHRFAEYYNPFGILASGLVLRDGLARVTLPVWGKGMVVVVMLALAVPGAIRGVGVIERRSVYTPDKYAQISAVLAKEATQGDMVFNSAYHDFPLLYFHQPKMNYVIGLDTHYLSYTEPSLYGNWNWIGQEVTVAEANDPAPIIRKRFNARWAVVDHHKDALAQRLIKSPHAELKLATQWGWLFRLELPEERAGKKIP